MIPNYVLWLAPLKAFGDKDHARNSHWKVFFSIEFFQQLKSLPGKDITNLPPMLSLILVRHPITKDLHLLLLSDFSEKTERDSVCNVQTKLLKVFTCEPEATLALSCSSGVSWKLWQRDSCDTCSYSTNQSTIRQAYTSRMAQLHILKDGAVWLFR